MPTESASEGVESDGDAARPARAAAVDPAEPATTLPSKRRAVSIATARLKYTDVTGNRGRLVGSVFVT